MEVLAALWVDATEVAGAIATALGLLGAVAIAVFYGRKATASVTAEAYSTDGSALLSTRPSVSAVGLFRLTFADEDGATIRVTEMVQTQEVVGWRVSFGVTVQRWPSCRQWSWADQVFVPRPTGTMGADREDEHGEGLVDDQGRAVRADEKGEG